MKYGQPKSKGCGAFHILFVVLGGNEEERAEACEKLVLVSQITEENS